MKRTLCILLSLLLALSSLLLLFPLSVAAAEIDMEPYYGQPFTPEGTTFGQVSFLVPGGTQGLTKDAWDNGIDHNTDLILISYEKDGKTYVDQTIREIKAAWGNLSIVRTCYTYDETSDGRLRLNLVFHMDDHNTLKPSNILAVTVKKGFVWCAGSYTSGISAELTDLTLDRDVTFVTQGSAGITAINTGTMPNIEGALRLTFERNDNAILKAISTVNLCASAIPGKTLGDLVTINGETVTSLVEQGKVARFNFYGETLIFHIDNQSYLEALKSEQYEIVIYPGFRWLTWTQDDWGNWAGTNKDNYTPVDGTLVLEPITFSVNTDDEVCVATDGISIEPGYKDSYYVGDRIDMSSLLIRINYASGKSETMPILEEMVTYDFSKAGQATVTVDVNGMTASFTVTVTEKPEETHTQTDTLPDEQPTDTLPDEQPTDSPNTDPIPDPKESTVTLTEDDPTQTTAEASDDGCGSLALFPIALAVACGAFVCKKKED